MKKVLVKITSLVKVGVLSCLLMVVSCSKEGNPEGVAEKFLNHVGKFEFSEAKKYCDEKTGSLLDMMGGLAGLAKDDELAKEKKENENKKITILKSEIDGEKATVFYTDGEEKDKEQKIYLKKVDGQWKVSMNKEDVNKEGMKKGMEDINDLDLNEEEGIEEAIEEVDSLN